VKRSQDRIHRSRTTVQQRRQWYIGTKVCKIFAKSLKILVGSRVTKRKSRLTQYSDSLKKPSARPRRNATNGGGVGRKKKGEGEIGRETFETLPSVDRETPGPRSFSLSLSLSLSPLSLSLDSIGVLRRWNRGRRPVAKGSFKSKQRYVIREPGAFREIRCFPRDISLLLSRCRRSLDYSFLFMYTRMHS